VDLLLASVKEPWLPNPGPQTQAFYSQAKSILYGGSAGGGKSDLLFGLAHEEHWQSIIFRRHFTEIHPLQQRIRELFEPDYGTVVDKKVTFKKGGFLELGAVKELGSERKYQGHPHDLKGFDEGTAFAYQQFLYLCGWLRSTRPGQRTRIVVTTNPPVNEEGMWVVRHWAPWVDKNYRGRKAMPGELRYFITTDEGARQEVDDPSPVTFRGKNYTPESLTFIPSSVEDNPFLADTDYASRLYMLPEPFRSKFLYGDFSAGITADPAQLIPREWVELAFERWRARPVPTDVPRQQIGADAARGGQDRAVLAPRRGNYVEQLIIHRGAIISNGPKMARLIQKEIQTPNTVVALDVVGIGTSPYDHLKLFSPNAKVWGMNGAASAKGQLDRTGNFGFVNCRAWWHWCLREALDPSNGDDLALPPDDELLQELCAVNFELTTSGIKIEDKEAIKKKLGGRSPDKGDAVVYAFARLNIAGMGVFDLYAADSAELARREAEKANEQTKDTVIRIVTR
jgi:hypothetical protein